MSLGKNQFKLTEWDWFKLQVRLAVLERGGKHFVTRYAFREPGERSPEPRFSKTRVNCYFSCKTTDDLINKKASRDKHLEFYVTWVPAEEQRLRGILRDLPTLAKELDLRKHIVFTVLHDYGMGSVPVCHSHDGKVYWDISDDRIPE
jgi:hypothetical protein